MKKTQVEQHPIERNLQKIKEDGIVVLDSVEGLPTGDEPFVSPDYVICIGHRGSIQLTYDGTPDISAPHVVAVIFPNHSVLKVSATDDFLCTLIMVNASLLSEPLLQIVGAARHRYEIRPSVVLDEREYNMLMHIVEVMRETSCLNIPDRRTMLMRQLECFLRLLGHYRNQLLADGAITGRLSTQFHSAVATHFHEHRDVAFYADLACLTPKHFSTVIRQETGHSASYWIHSCIIAKAQMLLHMNHELSVQAIADQLGFDDQASFSRFFKRETGFSPSEWRQRKR